MYNHLSQNILITWRVRGRASCWSDQRRLRCCLTHDGLWIWRSENKTRKLKSSSALSATLCSLSNRSWITLVSSRGDWIGLLAGSWSGKDSLNMVWQQLSTSAQFVQKRLSHWVHRPLWERAATSPFTYSQHEAARLQDYWFQSNSDLLESITHMSRATPPPLQ